MTRSTSAAATGASAAHGPGVAVVGLIGLGIVGAAAFVVGSATENSVSTAVGGAVMLSVLLLVTAWHPVWGLCAVAIAVPLPAVYSSDSTRLAAVAPVAAAVVAGWIVHLGGLRTALDWAALPRRALACLALAVSIAVAGSSHLLAGVRETLNLGVLLMLLIVTVHVAAESRDAARDVARVVAAVASVVGALAVLEMVNVIPGVFPRPGTPYNRASLGFGQPNALGLFLAVTFPLAVWRSEVARTRRARWLGVAQTALVGLGLLATFSRGSWASVALGAGVGFSIGQGRRTLRLWLVGLVGAVAFDIASGGLLRDTMQRTVGDWVVEQRISLTFAGILMYLAHPVLGVGPGGYALELDKFGAQIPQLWDYLPTPHDAFVQMAAEAGSVGLVAFLIFVGASGRAILRRARDAVRGRDEDEHAFAGALAWAFAVFCLEGFFVWPFSHGAGEAVVLIIGLGLAGRARR